MEIVPIFLIAILIGGIAFATHWFSEKAKIRRALTNASRVKIQEVQVGKVSKVVGVIVPIRP